MTTYSEADIYRFAVQGGFSPAQAVIASAIALAESGGNPLATHKNNNGSTDYGLWQINSIHTSVLHMGDWRNPVTNAKMARAVYSSQGWKAWTTYNTGAFKKFLSTQKNLQAGVSYNTFAPGYNPGKGGSYQTDAQGNVISQSGSFGRGSSHDGTNAQNAGLGDLPGWLFDHSPAGLLLGLSPAAKIGDLLKAFLTVGFWERVGYFFAGLWLLVFGFVLMVESNKQIRQATAEAGVVAGKAALA